MDSSSRDRSVEFLVAVMCEHNQVLGALRRPVGAALCRLVSVSDFRAARISQTEHRELSRSGRQRRKPVNAGDIHGLPLGLVCHEGSDT